MRIAIENKLNSFFLKGTFGMELMTRLICEILLDTVWFFPIYLSGEKCFEPVEKDIPTLPTSSPNSFAESNTQASVVKLKLQLFPIDEGTRRALELVSLRRCYPNKFDVE